MRKKPAFTGSTSAVTKPAAGIQRSRAEMQLEFAEANGPRIGAGMVR